MKQTLRLLFVVFINIVIFICFLAAIEVGARLTTNEPKDLSSTVQWQTFAPYVMFTNPHNPGGGFRWVDDYHQQEIEAKITNNRLGFSASEEFDLARQRPKAADERVVIFTGGSAAWGVGATSGATTVAGRLQTLLNESQATHRYTVLNLAMGGWVSFQQFVALALYGRNLQPDWVVSMDGTNDVAVACAHSQGAGYPMHYALMEAFQKAYTFGQVRPIFYRGWIENELLRHSVAYRRITGKTPIEFDILLDNRDPGVGRSVIRRTSWSDVEDQLALYIQTENEIVDLFPKAKIILSTQPLPFDFEKMFGHIYQMSGGSREADATAELEQQLNQIADKSRGKECGLDRWNDARNWFMPMSALQLQKLVEGKRDAGRDVEYENVGTLFPDLMEERKAFFIDPVHLNDAGMDVVARFYAAMILAADLPEQFQRPSRDSAAAEAVLAADLPPNRIRVVEATYGLNCRDFKVQPPGVNWVRVGNVTSAIATLCASKDGSCDFMVDAARIGDPASRCGKDLFVKWRCGAATDIHDAHLDGEAHGKSIRLSCPAQ